jgi:hypothetical protein
LISIDLGECRDSDYGAGRTIESCDMSWATTFRSFGVEETQG